MKKQLFNLLSLMMCLCLVLGTMTACGNKTSGSDVKESSSAVQKDEKETTTEATTEEQEKTTESKTEEQEKTTEAEVETTTEKQTDGEYADLDLDNTIWLDEASECNYEFYENGDVWIELAEDQYAIGEYEWDGQNGTLTLNDVTVNLVQKGDEGFFIEYEDDEELSLMEYVGPAQTSDETIYLQDTIWTFDEVDYIFYMDGRVEATWNGESEVYAYEWDGQSGHIETEDMYFDMCAKLGKLYVQGDDSIFYLFTFVDDWEEESESNVEEMIQIEDTIWIIDDVYYIFSNDGSVSMTDGISTEYGTYEWSGTFGYIEVEDFWFDLYVEDGELYLEGEDGESYVMTYSGVNGSDPGNTGNNDGNWQLEDNGDGTETYWDYTRNVTFTSPTWMTIILEGIGESTDAVIIGDNAGGYVIGDNLTDEWNSYDGTYDEFLYNYMNSYLYELFTPLYGEWEDNTHDIYDLSGSDDTNVVARFEGNFWNDNWDIQVLADMYTTDGGSIMVKCIFAHYGDEEQLRALYRDVVDMNGAYE